MSSLTILIGFVIATSIIVVLAIYAFKLTREVKRVESIQAARLQEIDDRAELAMDEVALGVTVLARAYLQNELSATEACLRVVHLLEQLQLGSLYRGIYPAIFEVAEKAQSFPILDDYKALSPKAQFELDRRRESLEDEFSDAVMLSMEGLKTFRRPRFDNAAV